MAESDLLLQTLQRIESKVDNSIVNHAERIASLETGHSLLKENVDDAAKWSTYKSLIAYGGVMLSHLGLNKIGWKI